LFKKSGKNDTSNNGSSVPAIYSAHTKIAKTAHVLGLRCNARPSGKSWDYAEVLAPPERVVGNAEVTTSCGSSLACSSAPWKKIRFSSVQANKSV